MPTVITEKIAKINLDQLQDFVNKKKIDPKDPVQNTVNITSHLGDLFAQLVYSNTQSGKSNAGSMFEHHIRTLMDVFKCRVLL